MVSTFESEFEETSQRVISNQFILKSPRSRSKLSLHRSDEPVHHLMRNCTTNVWIFQVKFVMNRRLIKISI